MGFSVRCWTTFFLFLYFVQCLRAAPFPTNFKFGIASSAYQIEGAWNADGKGENVYDHLTHLAPNLVFNRQNADYSADSYHRYKQDVQMLRHVGVDFYRFSISWTRVLPHGNTSFINEAGLQYYDNLINELLANAIEPIVTLYHFDLPNSIHQQGGLNSPQFVGYFVQYAEVLFKRYHDRVKTWITFNEPSIFCNVLYVHPAPPFIDRDPQRKNYLCTHHVLLAHAKAYDLYKRDYQKIGDRIGIAVESMFAIAKDASNAADVAAADRFMQFNLGQFVHPIFSQDGDYPRVMKDELQTRSKVDDGPTTKVLPFMTEAEKKLIKGKSDFFGINYYSSIYVASSRNCSNCIGSIDEQTIDDGWPKAKTDIYSVPDGLRGILNWIRKEYGNPEVMILENGWSDGGELLDVGRTKYLKSHLNATLYAIYDGCNVTAHTTWSLMDNFEWEHGYSAHFGLFHVDFNDPERPRRPKASVRYLRNVIKTKQV